MSAAKPIVFIHGMYLNALSWEGWRLRGAARGFVSQTPSWPYHDGVPAALRANPAPALGALRFRDVVEHFKSIIDLLPGRPVLIGHSMGGLVVQKLVNDGYAAAGVAVSPAPPRGIVVADPHFLRSNLPHLNPLAGNKPAVMTPERFHRTFCNTMSVAASDEAFGRFVVPESRNVPRSILTQEAAIDFALPHAPLLLIAADRDHLTPQSLIEKNAAAYAKAGNPVEFRKFTERSHFICNQPGWEDVADFAFDWLAALPWTP